MNRIASEIRARLDAWRCRQPVGSCLDTLVTVADATEHEAADDSYESYFRRREGYQCVHKVQFGRTTLLFEGNRSSDAREDLSDMQGLVMANSCSCRLSDASRRRVLWTVQAEEANGIPRCIVRIDIEGLKQAVLGEAQVAMPMSEVGAFTLCFAGRRCTEFLDPLIAHQFDQRLAGQTLQPVLMRDNSLFKRKCEDMELELQPGGKQGRVANAMVQPREGAKRSREEDGQPGVRSRHLHHVDINTFPGNSTWRR
eukprot:TRINITY_DN43702_c0_g1_i1.p1 TRINITY_DN43702_c0_g1~~TRINITY_DN43702_c0_g1_i1.p1  ORF type:complete len:255 (+),score=26.18 TRINITY_DN43702_c0_g1_i1:226-990(+)